MPIVLATPPSQKRAGGVAEGVWALSASLGTTHTQKNVSEESNL
jgi:hypothetical protein